MIGRQIHDYIYGYESLEDSTSEEECYLILNKQEVMSIINFFQIVGKKRIHLIRLDMVIEDINKQFL